MMNVHAPPNSTMESATRSGSVDFSSITSFALRIARSRTSCCDAWNCRPSTASISIPACGLRCSSVATSPRLTSRHTVSSTAVEDTVCLEVSRGDIATLLQRKPHAGMDMLTVLGRQFHASQQLVRLRAMRNANEVIEEKSTLPERIADSMVQFGGSWTFIIGFLVISSIYTAINVGLHKAAWDPYPFILLNLILSLLAAIQAPIIMMSQNRQDMKDRVRGELDYAVNRRAESEIQGLARKLNVLGEKMGDLEDLLRGKPAGGASG